MNKAASTRREKGNERRKLILSVTKDLLAQRPLEDLSLAEIASSAKIPVSSLYHFYPNILSVYSDLMLKFADELGEHLLQDMASGEMTTASPKSWQQLVNSGIESCAQFYQLEPAYQQLVLSGKAPAQVKSTDREGDARLAQVFLSFMGQAFELPKIPNIDAIFFNAIEVVDLFLSLDVMKNEQITASGVNEAKRACLSYLRSYLPDVLYHHSA